MSQITKQYTFSNGTKADPTQVNADFDTLFNQANAQDIQIGNLLTNRVNLKYPPAPLVGCKGDGVTSDSSSYQAIVNYCLQNKRTLEVPDGIYYLPTPVTIDYITVTGWTDFAMVGASVGSAYSDPATAGAIIKTNGNNAFEIKPKYPCSAIIFKNLHGYNSNSSKLGSFIKLDMSVCETTHQVKTLWVDSVTTNNYDKFFEFLDTTANFSNLPYTTLNQIYSYNCNSSLVLTGCGATIFKVSNSLFHGATAGAFIFNGGEFELESVWFEGCETTAIKKTGTRLSQLSLKDVYFELCGITSGLGAWQLNDNTNMVILGRSNLPGAGSMNPAILPKGCTLSCYTNIEIQIRSDGGLVKTPEKVSLNLGYINYVYYPVMDSVVPERLNKINNSFLNGGFEGGFIGPAQNMPRSVADATVWKEASTPIDNRDTIANPNAYNALIASFVYYIASGQYFGLDVNSGYTKNAVTTGFNTALVQVADTNNYTGYVCVVTLPLNPNDSVTRFTIQTRNTVSVSPAYLTLEPQSINGVLSKLGYPLTRRYQYYQSIVATGNYIFNERLPSSKNYYVKVKLLLNDGKDGVIEYNFYGITTNGSKYRDTVAGASKNASIVVALADGAHQDMFNISVTNNTAGAINTMVIVEYQN